MTTDGADEKEAFNILDYLKKQVNHAFQDDMAFEKFYMELGESRHGEDLINRYPYAKHYWLLDGIRERLYNEHRIDKPVQIFVDPCYQDKSVAVLTHGEMGILYAHLDKPDEPRWLNESEMEKDFEQTYRKVEQKYLRMEDR